MNELVHKQKEPGSQLRHNRDLLPDDEACTFKCRAPFLTAERVHPVNISVLKVMSCVSKWGSGSGELLAGMQASRPSESVAHK